jgi:superkiller protein 3
MDQAVFHNNQGVAYLNQGNTKNALFEFKTATELSPEFTEAWNNLGLAYMYLNQYDEAKNAFLKSISTDKKYPTPYNHMATLYYNQGNYEEALKWADDAIKRDKKYGDGYYNKGIILQEIARKSGDPKYKEAGEQAFRFATEADSRHYLANFELGNLYYSQGKIEQAIIRYKVALEIQPSAAQVWQQLGKLYQAKGQSQQAEFAFNKAMEASPNNPESHLNLGLYYLSEKNFVLADKELYLAYKADPDNPRVLFNLAYAKLSRAEEARGRQGVAAAQPFYQQAIEGFSSLLQKQPKFADAAYNLGYVYARTGDLGQAEQWYQKTLSIDPGYDRAMFSLGAMKLESGQKEAGVKYLCQFVLTTDQALQATKEAAQKIIAQNGGCK